MTFFAILSHMMHTSIRYYVGKLPATRFSNSPAASRMSFASYWLAIASFLFICLQGQARYYPIPYLINSNGHHRFQSHQVVQNLNGPWVANAGVIRNVPFWETDIDKLVMRRNFKVVDTFSNLCLYFEGIAWTAEIYLNGKLIIIYNQPFKPLILPLDNEWLSPVQNELKVVLTTQGKDTEWKHRRALGIHRPVWLLNGTDSLKDISCLAYSFDHDSVVIYNPGSATSLYHVTDDVLKRDLHILSAQPVRTVYFPAEPSRNVQAAFAKAGFKRAFKLQDNNIGIWYYDWPRQPGHFLNPDVFWFQHDYYATPALHSWHSISDAKTCNRKQDNFIILIIMLFPLLGLIILKLSNNQVFNAMPQWLVRDRLELELIADRKFLRSGQALMMTLNFLLILAASFTLMMYFFDANCFQGLDADAKDDSSIIGFLLFNGLHPVIQFLYVFAFLLIVLLVKWMFLQFISLIFRKQFLAGVYLDLQVLASFPFNIILLAFSVYMFYVGGNHVNLLLNIGIGLFSILLFRQSWMLFRGIYQLYHFHPLLIFLYICAFEILPWFLVI
jgi:hypothetical protein